MNEINKLQEIVDLFLRGKNNVKILEAGCGSSSYIHFGQNAYIAGIDISNNQLSRNNIVNEKILGDIQNHIFPADFFDIIVCWNVLEHLKCPEAALRNFLNSTKKGGIIILGFPNVISVRGLLTKYSPLFVHKWVYKYISGTKEPQEQPELFKTFLRFSISPKAIKRFALKHKLLIEYFKIYEDEFYQTLKKQQPLLSLIYRIFEILINIITFKTIARLASCIAVLRKVEEVENVKN